MMVPELVLADDAALQALFHPFVAYPSYPVPGPQTFPPITAWS